MKRKKLLEFANWLSNSRREFKMSSNCDCVAGQAAHWLRPKGSQKHVEGEPGTLASAFGMSATQSEIIYGGPMHLHGARGRKVAVAMLRFLAKYGRVDWCRAERTAKA